MSDFLAGLNEAQRRAVTAGEGPVLVLAGPGSGKTRVLTHRIAHLVGAMGVEPHHIMAVTFTNKAAGEMRSRVDSLLGGRLRGLQIGTFHAACARILRVEADHTPYGQEYVIYDTDDQRAAVEQAMGELGLDSKRFNSRAVLGAISAAKNELILPQQYVAADYFGEVVARVYGRYQNILLDSNAMDFDDLLLQMVLLLRDSPTVREKYQRRFAFVLVDEFQDTNMAQYQLVKLFGAPQDNIFAVGDEDQAIYAFRGADYRNVALFRKDYPQAQVVLLEQNYRSTQVVLDTARAVIDRNPNRTPKQLFTDRSGGDLVAVHEAYNETYEAQHVIEQIEALRKQYSYGDFAVMYRTNAQSRAFEELCIREGVPYRLVGGVGFYRRREVRDMLAYLRLVHNPDDKISFARVVNVPRRGIGPKSIQQFQHWTATAGLSYSAALQALMAGENSPLGGRPARLFADFGAQLLAWREEAAGGHLLELFDRIMAEVGYNLYLQEISDSPEQVVERSENLRELRGLLQGAMEDEVSLAEFLAEQALVADVDALDETADAVTLLTLHAAKGLEFPVVFLVGLEDGLLPHVRSFDEPEGMAEERRLLYVGITRAKDRLCMSYAFRRRMFGDSALAQPSRFLADLPAEAVEGLPPGLLGASHQRRLEDATSWAPSRLERDLQADRESSPAIRGKIVPFPGAKPLKFRTGLRVRHSIFGEGIVIESERVADDEEVTVAFENKKYGIKRLAASIASMTILEG